MSILFYVKKCLKKYYFTSKNKLRQYDFPPNIFTPIFFGNICGGTILCQYYFTSKNVKKNIILRQKINYANMIFRQTFVSQTILRKYCSEIYVSIFGENLKIHHGCPDRTCPHFNLNNLVHHQFWPVLSYSPFSDTFPN